MICWNNVKNIKFGARKLRRKKKRQRKREKGGEGRREEKKNVAISNIKSGAEDAKMELYSIQP